MTRIEVVVVAIPARNEASRLPAALDAIAGAVERCPVPVVVVVAADACTDATAGLAAERGATVVELRAARAGGARRAAVATGLSTSAFEPERVWVANTDADSRVPHDWLDVHLAFAADGVALLRGAVRPDPRELTRGQLRRWLSLNPPAERHDRVHGANLGVRGDVYLAVGGFPDVASDEDVRLVRAVEATTATTASTDRGWVTTSARLTGRAPRGFADYLRRRVVPA